MKRKYSTMMEDNKNISNFICEINETEESIYIFSIFCLIILDIAVIFGNSLVVLAICVERKLRSITSMFITSLAGADLAVGLLVLPFSSAREIMKSRWIFGEIWCQIWLAVDVWMCTASIYSLVAISLDRYIAIQKPLDYPRLITRRRAQIMTLCVWVLSFIICCPPVFVDWPAAFSGQLPPRCTCSPLGNNPAYIIYSATGSFFLPMAIILFVYVNIYRTVRSSTISHATGEMRHARTPGGSMRVHRSAAGLPGLSAEATPAAALRNRRVPLNNSRNSNGEQVLLSSPLLHSNSRAKPIDIVDHRNGTATLKHAVNADHKKIGGEAASISDDRSLPRSPSIPSDLDTTTSLPSLTPSRPVVRIKRKERVVFISNLQRQITENRFSKAVDKYFRQRRLSLEVKAAKTVAIVTGCFIFCWLGFAVIYLLQAFPLCPDRLNCIPLPVEMTFFWLGYVNSALNPLIYAVFNRKYRLAFLKILTCRLTKNTESSQGFPLRTFTSGHSDF